MDTPKSQMQRIKIIRTNHREHRGVTYFEITVIVTRSMVEAMTENKWAKKGINAFCVKKHGETRMTISIAFVEKGEGPAVDLRKSTIKFDGRPVTNLMLGMTSKTLYVNKSNCLVVLGVMRIPLNFISKGKKAAPIVELDNLSGGPQERTFMPANFFQTWLLDKHFDEQEFERSRLDFRLIRVIRSLRNAHSHEELNRVCLEAIKDCENCLNEYGRMPSEYHHLFNERKTCEALLSSVQQCRVLFAAESSIKKAIANRPVSNPSTMDILKGKNRPKADYYLEMSQMLDEDLGNAKTVGDMLGVQALKSGGIRLTLEERAEAIVALIKQVRTLVFHSWKNWKAHAGVQKKRAELQSANSNI